MTIKKLMQEFNRRTKELQQEIKKYNGRDAIIPSGEYKGRLGRIENARIDGDGTARALIRPYRLAGGPAEDFLNIHTDARTFWELTDDIIR